MPLDEPFMPVEGEPVDVEDDEGDELEPAGPVVADPILAPVFG